MNSLQQQQHEVKIDTAIEVLKVMKDRFYLSLTDISRLSALSGQQVAGAFKRIKSVDSTLILKKDCSGIVKYIAVQKAEIVLKFGTFDRYKQFLEELKIANS